MWVFCTTDGPHWSVEIAEVEQYRLWRLIYDYINATPIAKSSVLIVIGKACFYLWSWWIYNHCSSESFTSSTFNLTQFFKSIPNTCAKQQFLAILQHFHTQHTSPATLQSETMKNRWTERKLLSMEISLFGTSPLGAKRSNMNGTQFDTKLRGSSFSLRKLWGMGLSFSSAN